MCTRDITEVSRVTPSPFAQKTGTKLCSHRNMSAPASDLLIFSRSLPTQSLWWSRWKISAKTNHVFPLSPRLLCCDTKYFFQLCQLGFFLLIFSKTKGEEMPHLESAIKRRTAISDSHVKYAKNSSSQCCGCRQRGGHSNPVWRTHNLSDARANTNGNVQQMCKDLSPPTKKGTFIDNRNLRKLAVVHQSFFLSSFSKFLV